MPSPFPGMDPWLEGPLWTTVHSQLAAEIARQLAPRLLPKYVALTTEHFVLDDNHDLAMPEYPPQFSIEIRDTRERKAITAVQILSETSKSGFGRELYLMSRKRLLFSGINLVEIDLVRSGKRLPSHQPLPPASYYAFAIRRGRPEMSVWAIGLRDALPTIPVPLRERDPDVPLDLQLAFATIYDLLGYRYATDYTVPPEPPLSPEDRQWAEERLRSAGILPNS